MGALAALLLGCRSPRLPAQEPGDGKTLQTGKLALPVPASGASHPDFLTLADGRIYRPSAWVDHLSCTVRMTLKNPDPPSGFPADAQLVAQYKLRVDFQRTWPRHYYADREEVRLSPAGLSLPTDAEALLAANFNWALFPFFPMPGMGEFSPNVLGVERDGAFWKFLFRDFRAVSIADEQAELRNRVLWLDRDLAIAGYQFEGPMGTHLLTYEWESTAAADESRLSGAKIRIQTPLRENSQIFELKIGYALANGVELPFHVTVLARGPDGQPRRSVEFSYSDYRFERRREKRPKLPAQSAVTHGPAAQRPAASRRQEHQGGTLERVEELMYRPSAYLEALDCHMQVRVWDLEAESRLPGDLVIEAGYRMSIDFEHPGEKLFREQRVSLQTNRPGVPLPHEIDSYLHDLIKWGMNPIYLIPNVGELARHFSTEGKLGELRSLEIADSPETASPPGATARRIWLDAENRFVGYQYRDPLGIHRYELAWEPASLAGLLRPSSLVVTLRDLSGQTIRTSYSEMRYTQLEGLDLPSVVTLRTTVGRDARGRSAEFRFSQYQLKPRVARR